MFSHRDRNVNVTQKNLICTKSNTLDAYYLACTCTSRGYVIGVVHMYIQKNNLLVYERRRCRDGQTLL